MNVFVFGQKAHAIAMKKSLTQYCQQTFGTRGGLFFLNDSFQTLQYDRPILLGVFLTLFGAVAVLCESHPCQPFSP